MKKTSENKSVQRNSAIRNYYSKSNSKDRDEAIQRVINEIIKNMFEKSPVVRIEDR